MENRIKECQLDQPRRRRGSIPARADARGIGGERIAPPPGPCAPTVDSAAVDRLWFASLAYVLLAALRRLALPATRLAQATVGTIRLKLLKVGALVRVSVRRVAVQMASGHPWQRDWAIAHRALIAAAG